jgi:hypothetical protein
MRPGIFAVLTALSLGACSKVPGDPGFAGHPLDCAVGFMHADCEPGSLGYEKAAAINSGDDATCQSYGLEFGTPAYAQCRQNTVSQRASNNAALAAAIIASRPQPQPYQLPMPSPPPRPLSTNCQNYGQIINCQTQ